MNTRRLILATFMLAAPLFSASPLRAQSPEKPQPQASEPNNAQESYLLTLTIKITDHSKVSTEQTFTFTTNSRGANPASSSRDGDRIPIVSGSEGDKTQVQYIDIGTSIDVLDVKRLGSALACNLRIEISSVAPSPALKDDPIIRGSKFSVSPAVPLNKQITIYSSNDAVTGRKVEIQLQAQSNL